MIRTIKDYQYEKFIAEYRECRDILERHLMELNPRTYKFIVHCIERMIDARIATALYELKTISEPNQMERI